MKNEVLDDIRNYAIKRLEETYGYCGAAMSEDEVFLNSGGGLLEEKITIRIKCNATVPIERKIIYDAKFDANYYSNTGQWVEECCDDPLCVFCAHRPSNAYDQDKFWEK